MLLSIVLIVHSCKVEHEGLIQSPLVGLVGSASHDDAIDRELRHSPPALAE
jgi:hypothetical protein